jgi:hypothetical protein
VSCLCAFEFSAGLSYQLFLLIQHPFEKGEDLFARHGDKDDPCGDQCDTKEFLPGEGFAEKERREDENEDDTEAVDRTHRGYFASALEREESPQPRESAEESGENDEDERFPARCGEGAPFAEEECRAAHRNGNGYSADRRGNRRIDTLDADLAKDSDECGGDCR